MEEWKSADEAIFTTAQQGTSSAEDDCGTSFYRGVQPRTHRRSLSAGALPKNFVADVPDSKAATLPRSRSLSVSSSCDEARLSTPIQEQKRPHSASNDAARSSVSVQENRKRPKSASVPRRRTSSCEMSMLEDIHEPMSICKASTLPRRRRSSCEATSVLGRRSFSVSPYEMNALDGLKEQKRPMSAPKASTLPRRHSSRKTSELGAIQELKRPTSASKAVRRRSVGDENHVNNLPPLQKSIGWPTPDSKIRFRGHLSSPLADQSSFENGGDELVILEVKRFCPEEEGHEHELCNCKSEYWPFIRSHKEEIVTGFQACNFCCRC